jgi:hypothetical protein
VAELECAVASEDLGHHGSGSMGFLGHHGSGSMEVLGHHGSGSMEVRGHHGSGSMEVLGHHGLGSMGILGHHGSGSMEAEWEGSLEDPGLIEMEEHLQRPSMEMDTCSYWYSWWRGQGAQGYCKA